MAPIHAKGFLLPDDARLLFFSLLFSALYALLLRMRPIEKILRGIEEAYPARLHIEHLRDTELLAIGKVRKAAGFFLRRILGYKTPCLPRSLVLYRWCAERGIHAEIAIGVRKENGKLKGHAWLIIQGKPFMEEEQEIAGYRIMIKRSTGEAKES